MSLPAAAGRAAAADRPAASAAQQGNNRQTAELKTNCTLRSAAHHAHIHMHATVWTVLGAPRQKKGLPLNICDKPAHARLSCITLHNDAPHKQPSAAARRPQSHQACIQWGTSYAPLTCAQNTAACMHAHRRHTPSHLQLGMQPGPKEVGTQQLIAHPDQQEVQPM